MKIFFFSAPVHANSQKYRTRKIKEWLIGKHIHPLINHTHTHTPHVYPPFDGIIQILRRMQQYVVPERRQRRSTSTLRMSKLWIH